MLRIDRWSWAALVAGIVALLGCSVARAQTDANEASDLSTTRDPFGFAIIRTATVANDRATTSMLRAIADGPGRGVGGGVPDGGVRGIARFVVHFEGAMPSIDACSDRALERRRTLLDASARPVVPVVATAEWADCGTGSSDPVERLERTADALYGSDESLGQIRLSWLRQSAMPRFKRYRENLRWQSGLVLFATVNLPDNNNDYRTGAGRNGEFEERVVADRAWLERTFRLAHERKLAGIVLFVDAALRFSMPLRAPDHRVRERDGYYEFKLALRESATSFKGQVLLVQGHRGPAAPATATAEPDHPLRDSAGKVIENLSRIALFDDVEENSWLRIDVDPAATPMFHVSSERLFDDPSGELYGVPNAR